MIGSKTEVREKTKPTINTFIKRIHNKLFPDNSEKLTQIQNLAREKRTTIDKTIARIERRKKLELEIPNIEFNIENKVKEFQNWVSSDSEAISVFSNHSKESLTIIISEYNKTINEITLKYSGLARFIFDLTTKKKYAIALATSFESWLPDLKGLAEKQSINVKLTDLKNGVVIITTLRKLVKFLESGILLKEKKFAFENEIGKLKSQLQETQNECESIRAIEKELQAIITESMQTIDKLGLPLLDELIHKRLENSNAAELNIFKDYIPDNIPWIRQEIPKFVEIAVPNNLGS